MIHGRQPERRSDTKLETCFRCRTRSRAAPNALASGTHVNRSVRTDRERSGGVSSSRRKIGELLGSAGNHKIGRDRSSEAQYRIVGCDIQIAIVEFETVGSVQAVQHWHDLVMIA